MKHPVTARLVRAMIKRDRLVMDEDSQEFTVAPRSRSAPPQQHLTLQNTAIKHEDDDEEEAEDKAERAFKTLMTPEWRLDAAGKFSLHLPEKPEKVSSEASTPSSMYSDSADSLSPMLCEQLAC